MDKEQARKCYEVVDLLSKLDVNTLSEQQLAERTAMIAQLQEKVKQRLDPKCWTGKHKEGTKIKGGVRVNNCVPNESVNQGIAEGSLNEFAPDGFNGGDDGDEFSPEMAKMAQDDGFTKGAGLADGATTERAMKIQHWDQHDGGMYKQYFAKGFKQGRLDKIRHNNKQYNLNLKLMKDGSIRHGEQGVSEGFDNNVYFEVDSENAYNHIMKKFGSVIDWEGDTMVAPRKYWGAIQELAYSAGGEASEVGGEQGVSEAGNPAQQAAIAINMKKHHKKPMGEADGEYDDEAGMAQGSLHTMSRAVNGLMDTIQQGDNLPEWAQEKLSLAEDYLTTVWDYLLSQKEQGIEPKLESVNNGMPKDVKNKTSKLTAVNIKKTEAVSEEINTEAYERLQKVFAFKNYES